MVGARHGLRSPGAARRVDGSTTRAGRLRSARRERRPADARVPADHADWARATPAAGWSVQDQVNHLAWFDEAAALAVTDPAEFRAGAAGLTGDFPDLLVSRQRGMAPRPRCTGSGPPGPPSWTSRPGTTARSGALVRREMSLTSSVTARLMETWAHGQDVADALGVTRAPTARLRHVCHLGVATRAHSFRLRGLPVPASRRRGRAVRSGRCTVDLGVGRGRPARPRLGPGLLPGGDPAPAPGRHRAALRRATWPAAGWPSPRPTPACPAPAASQ